MRKEKEGRVRMDGSREPTATEIESMTSSPGSPETLLPRGFVCSLRRLRDFSRGSLVSLKNLR